MKYLKILLVTVVASIFFSIITAFIQESNADSATVSAKEPAMGIVHKKKQEIYKERQRTLKKELDVYFQKAIVDGDLVGAGLSIVHGDSILISSGFGKRNVARDETVDGETVFRLGSLSKGFGGVLAASLQSDGRLRFDDKIVSYLPDFKFGDDKNTQSVKLEHILSHTSGTPYHSFTNLVEAGIPVADIANRFDEVTPISAPGEQYSYQNAMFALSQEVMQKVTGENVKTLLQTKLFTPLGMTHMSMHHEDLLKEDNVAFPHKQTGKNWRTLPLTDKYYNAVLAGGINASSEDMGKWMRFLLGRNPEVLPSKAIEQVFKPVISFKNKNKYYQRWDGHLTSSYGLGWRIHKYENPDSDGIETVWHHGGSVNNYRNEIALFPRSDLGICVLLNGNSKLARTVIPDVHEIVIKILGSNTSQNIKKSPSDFESQVADLNLE